MATRERFRFPRIAAHRVVHTPPIAHALTLTQVRERLRLGSEVDSGVESDITLMIAEAEAAWEDSTSCSLMPQISELRLTRFPRIDTVVNLAHWPIRSVDAVDYWASSTASAPQTWATVDYEVDTSTRGGILRAKKEWPSVDDRFDAVTIRLSVGYAAAADIPADIKTALLLHVGERYRWREDSTEKKLFPIPRGFQSIADRHRLDWIVRAIR